MQVALADKQAASHLQLFQKPACLALRHHQPQRPALPAGGGDQRRATAAVASVLAACHACACMHDCRPACGACFRCCCCCRRHHCCCCCCSDRAAPVAGGLVPFAWPPTGAQPAAEPLACGEEGGAAGCQQQPVQHGCWQLALTPARACRSGGSGDGRRSGARRHALAAAVPRRERVADRRPAGAGALHGGAWVRGLLAAASYKFLVRVSLQPLGVRQGGCSGGGCGDQSSCFAKNGESRTTAGSLATCWAPSAPSRPSVALTG